jgi:hypothetical protein
MIGNGPVPTMDELSFKIVKHRANDDVTAQVAATLDS